MQLTLFAPEIFSFLIASIKRKPVSKVRCFFTFNERILYDLLLFLYQEKVSSTVKVTMKVKTIRMIMTIVLSTTMTVMTKRIMATTIAMTKIIVPTKLMMKVKICRNLWVKLKILLVVKNKNKTCFVRWVKSSKIPKTKSNEYCHEKF